MYVKLLASMGNVVSPQCMPLIMVWFVIIATVTLCTTDDLLLSTR